VMTRPPAGTLVPLPRASHPALAAEGVQPEHQLRAELAVLDQLRALVDDTYAEASAPDAEPQLRWLYLQLVEAAAKQTDRVRTAEQELRRALCASSTAAHWEERRAELTAALEQRYGRLGPQYEILIRRLLAAELRAERLEAEERDVSAVERRRAAADVIDAVAALQRYTEAEKAEWIARERHEASMAILRQLETIIAPEHPDLWHWAVSTLRDRLGGTRAE
jgi:hypothetical protein